MTTKQSKIQFPNSLWTAEMNIIDELRDSENSKEQREYLVHNLELVQAKRRRNNNKQIEADYGK